MTWKKKMAGAAPTRLRAVTCSALAVVALAGPASAQCSFSVPGSVLVQPTSHGLFYGDSITVGILGTPYHYALLVRHMLAAAYCDFELFDVDAIGQRGSHYLRYARRIGRDLTASEFPFDWVMFQDSGRALKLAYERDPDSPRSFPIAVQQTIDEARAVEPSITVFLATTPPLDHANATASWEVRYDRVNDFDDHNDALEELAGEGGHPVVTWATDVCRAYAEAPDAEWTRDGVHPQPFGEVLFALSILRSFGVPRADLKLDDLAQFHVSLDPTTVSTIADWVYAPNPACD
ncbi:MAG TPA: SGNH/GDSL hydrolase family protein [Candidatus Binatia bacterium]|nr:SGNH/GDSL hydrolase family protein [Candidatus Binatia bacterium]